MRKYIVALILALATLVPVGSAHATDPTVRVLINGDSITQAVAGQYSWRYFLDRFLTQAHVNFDFVGPNKGEWSDCQQAIPGVVAYADPRFDQDHAARCGMAMWEMLDDKDCTPINNGCSWSPNIASLVTKYNPDIVIEQLGVNDLGWSGFTPEGLVELARQYVNTVQAVSPDIDIVLGQSSVTWQSASAQYNNLLKGLESMSTETSKVVVAIMPEATPTDTLDGVHPNASGELKIASGQANAVGRLLGKTLSAPVYDDATTLRMARVNNTVSLHWSLRGAPSAIMWRRVSGGPWVKVGPVGSTFSQTIKKNKVYLYRVQLVRWMPSKKFSNIIQIKG